MSDQVTLAELRRGDVLLYHRGDCWFSDVMCRIDDSPYSHASIYDGTRVVEALPEHGGGLFVNDVRESVEALGDAESPSYAVVYRFCVDGSFLGEPAYPDGPVADRIEFYKRRRGDYAYAQVAVLAMAKSMRRLTEFLHWREERTRERVDEELERLNRSIYHAKSGRRRREALTCCELVARCFSEAGDAYRLEILANYDEPGNAGPFVRMGDAFEQAGGSVGKADVEDRIATYREEYRKSKLNAAEDRCAVPDFVTPIDLVRCKKLRSMGRLVFDRR